MEKHTLSRFNDFFFRPYSITLKVNTYESGGTVPRLLNLDTKWRSVMTITTWLLLSPGNGTTVAIGQEAAFWVPNPAPGSSNYHTDSIRNHR